ncbi:MAG: polyprenol monophosphomannose synthase [Kiritimatiellae bacterium]|nr:polyprenol monophosphomannose synthase [Kiritimatiellia bacterium]
MKCIVAVPTYDEKENAARMSEAILSLNGEADGVEFEPLFIDDNSPDGTGEILDALAAKDRRVHVLHREKKEGLGRAYVAGFKEALRLGADRVVQMDCDFSHDPGDLPRLVLSCEGEKALSIGSRYVKGGGTPGWPLFRRIISVAGGMFIRLVTGMKIRDVTGGFKCWSRKALEGIGLDEVASSGYSFQLEMNYRAWQTRCRIVEIPILFTDRVAGYSKITPGIALESVCVALRLGRGK